MHLKVMFTFYQNIMTTSFLRTSTNKRQVKMWKINIVTTLFTVNFKTTHKTKSYFEMFAISAVLTVFKCIYQLVSIVSSVPTKIPNQYQQTVVMNTSKSDFKLITNAILLY